MRRTTPNCELVAEAQRDLLGAIAGLDGESLALATGALEPFVREARKARILGVIAARLGSVTVLLDAPHDPHNGAAVLRSCDAFGVHRLHVLTRGEGFLASREVSRGSQRWVDVCVHAGAEDAARSLAEGGFELVAAAPDGALRPEDLGGRGRVALVLGNERTGIGRDLGAACVTSVRIPMRGFAESLNMSVTAAILLEHATRGRPGDLGDLDRARLYLRALVLTLPHAPEVLAARGLSRLLPRPDSC